MTAHKIFTPATDGKYGIDTLSEVVRTANQTYDLYDRVLGDDGKLTLEDAGDVLAIGPGIARSVSSIVASSDLLDNELFDLSEAEKGTLIGLAGERIDHPGYAKIFDGLLNIIDGISELRNSDNPVD